MRGHPRVCTAFLVVFLCGCSGSGSLFSSDPDPQGAASRDPSSESCVRIATQRAEDAVAAGYVAEGSADEKDVYSATYRDCATWQGGH